MLSRQTVHSENYKVYFCCALQQETVVYWTNKKEIIRRYPYSQHSSECFWWRVWVSHWCVPKQSAASVSGRSLTGSPLPRSVSHLPAFLKHETRSETHGLILWNIHNWSVSTETVSSNCLKYNDTIRAQHAKFIPTRVVQLLTKQFLQDLSIIQIFSQILHNDPFPH